MKHRRLVLAAVLAAAICGPAAAWTTGPFIIYFGFGSDRLEPRARESLDMIAQTLATLPDRQFLLEGYADRSGPADINLRLSCRRARAVHAYLLAKGVAPERMAVAAHGEERPLVETDDGVREPTNRRVEFVFMEAERVAAARVRGGC